MPIVPQVMPFIDGATFSRGINETNLEAAYSLSKLRGGYGGNAIKVRRSGDNAEDDFGFDGVGLDVSTLETWVSAGGGTENGFVVTWYDQSGKGRNISQSNTSRQPRIVVGGDIEEDYNNNPTVNFLDGTSTYLATSTQHTINQPITTFAVASLPYDNNDYATLASADTNSFQHESNNINDYYSFKITTNLRASVGSPIYTDDFLLTVLFNTDESLVRTDGVDITDPSYDDCGTGSPTFLYLGGKRTLTIFYWYGTISEFLIYEANKTPDFDDIEDNINDYYGIY